MHGGAISRLINNIDISCLASNLPEYLEVDVAELDVGDSIFLSGLQLPEGEKLLFTKLASPSIKGIIPSLFL